MESNWRFNVADLGYALSDWELAARRVVGPQVQYVVKRQGFAGFWFLYVVSSPGTLPVLNSVHRVPSTHPHFPYGEPVIAD